MVIQDDTRITRNNVNRRCKTYYETPPKICICSPDLINAKTSFDNIFKNFWTITNRSFDKIRLQTEPFLERLKTRSVCRKCSNTLPVSTSKSTQIPETKLVTMRRFSDEYVGKLRRNEESQDRRRFREEEIGRRYDGVRRCCREEDNGRRFRDEDYDRRFKEEDLGRRCCKDDDWELRYGGREYRRREGCSPCSYQRKIGKSCQCVVCEECKRKKKRRLGYFVYCYVKKKLKKEKKICDCPSFCECRNERKYDVGTTYSSVYTNLRSSQRYERNYKPPEDCESSDCCCCCCCCCCDEDKDKEDVGQCQCCQTTYHDLQTDATQTDAIQTTDKRKKCCCRCCCKKNRTNNTNRKSSPPPEDLGTINVSGTIKRNYTGSIGKTRIYKSSSTQHQPSPPNDLIEVLLQQSTQNPIIIGNEFYSPISGQKYNLAPKTINSEPINLSSALLSEDVFPTLEENKFEKLRGSLANRSILSAAYKTIVNNFSVHQFIDKAIGTDDSKSSSNIVSNQKYLTKNVSSGFLDKEVIRLEDAKKISSALMQIKRDVGVDGEENNVNVKSIAVQSESEDEDVVGKIGKKKMKKKSEVLRSESEDEEDKKKKECKLTKKKKGDGLKSKQLAIAAILDKYSVGELERMLKRLDDSEFKPCDCPKKNMEELLNAAKIVSQVLDKNILETSPRVSEERKVSWSQEEAEPNLLKDNGFHNTQEVFEKTVITEPMPGCTPLTIKDVSIPSFMYMMPKIPEEDCDEVGMKNSSLDSSLSTNAEQSQGIINLCLCSHEKKTGDSGILQRPSTSNGRGNYSSQNIEKYANFELPQEQTGYKGQRKDSNGSKFYTTRNIEKFGNVDLHQQQRSFSGAKVYSTQNIEKFEPTGLEQERRSSNRPKVFSSQNLDKFQNLDLDQQRRSSNKSKIYSNPNIEKFENVNLSPERRSSIGSKVRTSSNFEKFANFDSSKTKIPKLASLHETNSKNDSLSTNKEYSLTSDESDLSSQEILNKFQAVPTYPVPNADTELNRCCEDTLKCCPPREDTKLDPFREEKPLGVFKHPSFEEESNSVQFSENSWDQESTANKFSKKTWEQENSSNKSPRNSWEQESNSRKTSWDQESSSNKSPKKFREQESSSSKSIKNSWDQEGNSCNILKSSLVQEGSGSRSPKSSLDKESVGTKSPKSSLVQEENSQKFLSSSSVPEEKNISRIPKDSLTIKRNISMIRSSGQQEPPRSEVDSNSPISEASRIFSRDALDSFQLGNKGDERKSTLSKIPQGEFIQEEISTKVDLPENYSKSISLTTEDSDLSAKEITNTFQMVPLATVIEEALETNSNSSDVSEERGKSGFRTKTGMNVSLTKKGYVKLKQVFKYNKCKDHGGKKACEDGCEGQREEREGFVSVVLEKDGVKLKDEKVLFREEREDKCGRCLEKRPGLEESDSVSSDL